PFPYTTLFRSRFLSLQSVAFTQGHKCNICSSSCRRFHSVFFAAGMARASKHRTCKCKRCDRTSRTSFASEENHFLWGLKTHGPHYRSPTEVHLLIPLESTDLRSRKLK